MWIGFFLHMYYFHKDEFPKQDPLIDFGEFCGFPHTCERVCVCVCMCVHARVLRRDFLGRRAISFITFWKRWKKGRKKGKENTRKREREEKGNRKCEHIAGKNATVCLWSSRTEKMSFFKSNENLKIIISYIYGGLNISRYCDKSFRSCYYYTLQQSHEICKNQISRFLGNVWLQASVMLRCVHWS